MFLLFIFSPLFNNYLTSNSYLKNAFKVIFIGYFPCHICLFFSFFSSHTFRENFRIPLYPLMITFFANHSFFPLQLKTRISRCYNTQGINLSKLGNYHALNLHPGNDWHSKAIVGHERTIGMIYFSSRRHKSIHT